jgi:hypothetical protein
MKNIGILLFCKGAKAARQFLQSPPGAPGPALPLPESAALIKL